MSSLKTDFLTVREVAEYLKMSTLTIYKYIKDQQLEALEFGGHYRIKRSSFFKFLEDHKVSYPQDDSDSLEKDLKS